MRFYYFMTYSLKVDVTAFINVFIVVYNYIFTLSKNNVSQILQSDDYILIY